MDDFTLKVFSKDILPASTFAKSKMSFISTKAHHRSFFYLDILLFRSQICLSTTFVNQ
jgi:hypothetical protein